MTDNPKSGFVKSLLIYGSSRLFARGAGFLLLPIYISELDAITIGDSELLASLLGLAVVFGLMQFESGIARFFYEKKLVDRLPDLVSTAFAVILGFSGLTCLILVLTRHFLFWWLQIIGSDVEHSFLTMVAIVPCMSVCAISSILLRYEKRPVLFAVLSFVQFLIIATISIWLVVVCKQGLFGIWLSQLVGWGAAAICGYALVIHKYIRLRFDSILAMELWRYSFPQVPSVFVNWMKNNATRFLILYFLTKQEVGVYGVATKLCMVFPLADSAIRMAWGPTFWELASIGKTHAFLERFFSRLSVLTFIAITGFGVIAPLGIMLLLPAEYYASAGFVGVLGFSYGLSILVQPLSVGPELNKTMWQVFYVSLVSVLVGLLAACVGIIYLGLLGAALGGVLGNLAAVFCFWRLTEYQIGVRYPRAPFLVGLLVASAVVFATSVSHRSVEGLVFCLPFHMHLCWVAK